MTSLFDGQERIFIKTGGYMQCKIISIENKTINIEFSPHIEKVRNDDFNIICQLEKIRNDYFNIINQLKVRNDDLDIINQPEKVRNYDLNISHQLKKVNNDDLDISLQLEKIRFIRRSVTFSKIYKFDNNIIDCNIDEFKSDIEEYCYNNHMSDEEASKIIDTIFRIFAKCRIDFYKTIFAQVKNMFK